MNGFRRRGGKISRHLLAPSAPTGLRSVLITGSGTKRAMHLLSDTR
jgi:hypothetical protein